MNVQDRIELLRALTEVEEWKSRAITAEKGQSLLKGRAKQLEAEVERAEAQAHEFESEAIHNGEIMQSLAVEVTALRERAAALQARVAELETENIDLISEIVQIDCRDYGRGEYQTQSLANQELIYRLVAAGRMRHKRNDHKDRPIYEFVPAAQEEAPAT